MPGVKSGADDLAMLRRRRMHVEQESTAAALYLVSLYSRQQSGSNLVLYLVSLRASRAIFEASRRAPPYATKSFPAAPRSYMFEFPASYLSFESALPYWRRNAVALQVWFARGRCLRRVLRAGSRILAQQWR